VAWVDRHAVAIVVAHVVALVASVYLIAYRLPLRADFAYLLPQDAPAVRDMRRLEARLRTNDTVLVVIEAPDAAARAAATREMMAGARAIPRDLAAQVDGDDAAARAFLDDHRFQLVPLPELDKARDALARRIKEAKLDANPLYVDLDDDDDARRARDQANKKELDDLRARWRDADARLRRPSNVSKDGRLALVQVKTAMSATEVGRGRDLLDALGTVRDRVTAAHPGVSIGFAGDLVTALAEHDAIVHGTLVSCVVTTLLVGLLLALYFRSALLLGLLITTLAIGTTVSFGAAALTIGHLNAATAFLGAIIAGNGVNYGILLIARFLEERRRHDLHDAVAASIAGTLRPTLIASLGASIAYGSLAATSFKGFADFAVIGAIGMALCWIASFVLLPALILRLARRPQTVRAPLVGAVLVRCFGFRRPRLVVAVAGAMVVAALAVVIHYVAADPFEYDLRELGSDGPAARAERQWMKVADHNFGRGHAGRTFIAADRIDQVPAIVSALEAEDAGKPPERRTIGTIESILDVVPADQPARLARLAEIRSMLDDDALEDLDDHERAELDELRPPAHLAPITVGQLPAGIRDQLTEKDGRVGYVVSVRPAPRLDELDGHDVIRFAAAVSRIDLGDGETVTTSGPSVIFANILEVVAHDGPVVTVIAAAGLVVLVLLLVGGNRRGAAVLIATGSGALFMVATCALLQLKVNFLDFVALPITLGLGVDYAINIAYRYDRGCLHPCEALRTSGSAVLLCSLTTVIGYGSLLVSQNLAIRGFGAASLIGEITTVLTALTVVPALLAVSQRRVAAQAPARADEPRRVGA